MRDEYLSIERQTGKPHPALHDGPECPPGLEYLLGWFGELASARSNSGFGANPIGFGEIKAWAELTGRCPTPLEVHALRRLDLTYITVFGRKDDG